MDFNRWLDLRSRIEASYLRGEAPGGARTCGGDSLAYVACDGPYLVQVRNPGVSPPNLSRVRELAVGFVRDSGPQLDSAELWVDDIRLSQVVSTPGYAGAVNVHVVAADLGEVNLALTKRDAQFRQIGEPAPYVGSSQLALSSTLRLEKFGLDRLGISAPLTLRLDRSSQDPYFLDRTDVLAGGLDGLRRPHASQTGFSFALRRLRRGTLWWQRLLVDNLSFSASGSRGAETTQLGDNRSGVLDLRGDYRASPADRNFRYVPGFLVRLVHALPAFLAHSDFARGLEGAVLRWTPAQIRFASSFNRTFAQRQTFRVPIATQSDTLSTTVVTTTLSLQNEFGLELRPFRSVTAAFDWTQLRDLRDYGDTTTMGVLTRLDSRRALGVNLGFERRRTVGTRFFYQPTLAAWLRPRASLTSAFGLTRDPTAGVAEREGGDSSRAFRIPLAFENQRATDLGTSLDLSRLVRGLAGDSAFVSKLADRLNVLDLSSRLERRSQFSQRGVTPGLRYQLALGGSDAFRMLDGQLADAALESREVRASGGVRLPLGISATTDFQRRTTSSWARRGAGQSVLEQTELNWPNVTGRWIWSPRQRLVRAVLSSVSATAGWRIRETRSVQTAGAAAGGLEGGGDAIRSDQTTTSVPLALTMNWAARVITTLSVSENRSEDNRSGNLTRSDRAETSADLAFSFRPPRQFLPLPSDVRTAFRYANSVSTGCILRAGDSTCVAISDSRRRQVNFTMDTDMPPNVSAGVSVSYIVTEDAQTNRKFAQWIVTASVTVAFTAGEIR